MPSLASCAAQRRGFHSSLKIGANRCLGDPANHDLVSQRSVGVSDVTRVGSGTLSFSRDTEDASL